MISAVLPRVLRGLLALGLVASLGACDNGMESGSSTLDELLENRGNFETFDAVLSETGLASIVDQGDYTILAPTDEAFRSLGAGTLARLREADQRAILTRVVGAHVIPGARTLDAFQDGDVLTTIEGNELTVRVEAGRVTVGGLQIQRAFPNESGIVYPVNSVYQDHLSLNERLRTSELLQQARRAFAEAGLLDLLSGDGPFTLFAPIDDAFQALGDDALNRLLANPSILEQVAANHIVRGAVTTDGIGDGIVLESEAGSTLRLEQTPSGVTVEGAQVVLADIPVGNGVLHLTGSVLTSNLGLREVAELAGLDLWLEAVEAAGYTELLDGDGPFTLFTPFDPAFNTPGGQGQIDFLLEEDVLDRVVAFHIVPGRYATSDLVSVEALPTLEGSELLVVAKAGDLRVGNEDLLIRTTQVNLPARNGIIHVLAQIASPPLNMFDMMVFQGLRRFVQGVHLAEREAIYETGDPLTVFAFSNNALEGNGTLRTIYGDPSRRDELTNYLNYHTVPGAFTPSDLDGGTLPTLYGAPLPYVTPPGGVIVGDSLNGLPNGVAAIFYQQQPVNGALYTISRVLGLP